MLHPTVLQGRLSCLQFSGVAFSESELSSTELCEFWLISGRPIALELTGFVGVFVSR